MLKGIDCVLIWTEDPEKLAPFYETVLGLKKLKKLEHPQDTGTLYEFPDGGAVLWIGKHSEVKGKSKDKFRHMVNFLVDSVDETYTELKKKGVKFLVDPFPGPTGNGYFATFEDPEGNILQIWSRNK